MWSKRFSRTAAAVAGIALAACSDAPTTGDLPQVTSAHFVQAPAGLGEAMQVACADPGDEIHSPVPSVIQCRMLLEPAATANAILAYDGIIETLPRLVISLARTGASDGEVVTSCAFLMVPQRDGRVQRVLHDDRRIEQKLRGMLARLGGTPMTTPPGDAVDACLPT